ncbi:Subtilisin E precursor [Posidoniimonas polymericola]|uniref:Subtilisin E n=1 Tax=Posidoniimonas polymericola TaxID=2528002 RepID=A0A5C5YS43_9BACT|nr:S8 family serine peptidase [Posidoniimonas polymericola]TWT77772.1 Subtilisin E precursor [Posidoniimonas polymericola]
MSKKRTKKARRSTLRRSQLETLEARQVMSADPLADLLGGAITQHAIAEGPPEMVPHAIDQGMGDLAQHGGLDYSVSDPNADFWLDNSLQTTLDEQVEEIEQTLASAHQLTGMDQVKTNFGFTGAGQTVAVIDSGIAYNHYALGGGLGSNYRVVGGYDFTENDSDPYDDGTEGSHGTHVAGIVGADDGVRSGVAPGVDLVGLRVFADNGAGYFSWVESALKWVHNNRDAFENPITAVNLSLGTKWNSTSIPSWTTLEDEFAQLKADGIFISVSAGNSFNPSDTYTGYGDVDFSTPGLSYPAASPNVVPVMSSDDSGLLSYFSQRHQNAISAPGRYVYSTVPDYAGNNNGVDDDWANFSGTSMAAPYVAGASVIIREAMEFVGMTGIDQDDIFDLMMDTADSFYDSNTGLNYSRLNMQAAIDAIMPADDFGNSVLDAYNLGTITAGPATQAGPMAGHIAKMDDADYFTFTAGATGTVTFAAQNTTHHMAANWDAMGADGQASGDGSSYTINVVAGQQYNIALSSSDGLGYYDLVVTADSAFTFVDWGATGIQETKSTGAISGESFFRVQAGRDGYVTAETLQSAGITAVELLNANQQVVATGAGGRVDYYASAGEELYLRVTGSTAGVDMRLTNAVSVSGGVVTVLGTSGDDAFTFAAGATTHKTSLNGVAYSFSSSQFSSASFAGGAGADSSTLSGGSGADNAILSVGTATLTGAGYSVSVVGSETNVINGKGGANTARFYDSAGADVYSSYSDRAVMTGAGYYSRAAGFTVTLAFSSTGGDLAYMYDGAGNEVYSAYSDRVVWQDNGTYRKATGFATTIAFSNGGQDVAYVYDTPGDDLYVAYADRVVMEGASYSNRAWGFATTVGVATIGNDISLLYDSAGDDLVQCYADRSYISGAGFYSKASGFDRTIAFASQGNDVAYFFDSAGDDVFTTSPDQAVLTGAGFYARVVGFDATYGYSHAGNDLAYMYDGAGNDAFRAYSDRAVMSGAGYYNKATGFGGVLAFSTSGADTAEFFDSAGADLFRGYANRSVMSGAGYFNKATGFASVSAHATAGNDMVELHDGIGDDALRIRDAAVSLLCQGVSLTADGFDSGSFYATNGGDNVVDADATDFAFNLIGDWA